MLQYRYILIILLGFIFIPGQIYACGKKSFPHRRVTIKPVYLQLKTVMVAGIVYRRKSIITVENNVIVFPVVQPLSFRIHKALHSKHTLILINPLLSLPKPVFLKDFYLYG